MQKSTVIKLSALLAVAAIIAFFVFRAFSYSMAIGSGGFRAGGSQTLVTGIDPRGDEYQIVKASATGEGFVLLRLVKNGWGFWSFVSAGPVVTEGVAQYEWEEEAGIRRFAPEDDPIFEKEQHIVYYVDKAAKEFHQSSVDIPSNVTLSVQNIDDTFSVHVISFAQEDVLDAFDLETTLLDEYYSGGSGQKTA